MAVHNRYNAIFNEEVELYVYFYKEQNGEIVLREPSSIGYVQIINPEGGVLGELDVDGIETIQTGTAGFPGENVSSVSPGVKKIRFRLPEFNYTEQVKFIDKWVDAKDENGSALAIQNNIFYASPKKYGIDDTQPTNEIDLSLSVDKESVRKGEKKFLRFSITDANNVLTNVDTPVLSLTTETGEIIQSNISGRIPENLDLIYFLDTVQLQSYIDANYIASSASLDYPLQPTFISKELDSFDLLDDARRLYVSKRGETIRQFNFPSSVSLNLERKVSPKFISSELNAFETSNETVRFHLKENDGDYIPYYLPQNIFDISEDEKVIQVVNYLTDQKDALENKDDLFYTFSSVSGKVAIVGNPGTSSLSLKHVEPETYSQELDGDFALYEGEIRIKADSVIAGPTVISAPLDYFSSLDYAQNAVIENDTLTTNWTSVSDSSFTAVNETTRQVIYTSSTISQKVLMSIQENDGEFIAYSLPYIAKGQSGTVKASQIALRLERQAEPNRLADKAHYSFSYEGASVVLSADNTVKQITLKHVDNAAYNKLLGGFSVEETDGATKTIKGEIEVPLFETASLTSYSSLSSKSVLYIAQNEESYIKYTMPSNEASMTPYDLANNLQDQREAYGTSLFYDFGTSLSNELTLVGEAVKCEKISLKYPVPEKFAGDYLNGEFSVVAGNIRKHAKVPVRATASDIAYTMASTLETQRKTMGYVGVDFSHAGNRFILKANVSSSDILVLDQSFVAPNLVSSSLNNFSAIGNSTLMRIKENQGNFINYTAPNYTSSLTASEKASTVASVLESQRNGSTYYYFSAIGSTLALVGLPVYTSSVTLDNVLPSSVFGKLGGDFSVGYGSTLAYDDSKIALESSIASRLGNDFGSAVGGVAVGYRSDITSNNVITTVKPLNSDETYKWVTELIINEKLVKLDTDFTFSE